MHRRSLAATFGVAVALPLLFGFHGADCDDPVAEAIHEVEETTGLDELHEVEEAYCAVVGD